MHTELMYRIYGNDGEDNYTIELISHDDGSVGIYGQSHGYHKWYNRGSAVNADGSLDESCVLRTVSRVGQLGMEPNTELINEIFGKAKMLRMLYKESVRIAEASKVTF